MLYRIWCAGFFYMKQMASKIKYKYADRALDSHWLRQLSTWYLDSPDWQTGSVSLAPTRQNPFRFV